MGTREIVRKARALHRTSSRGSRGTGQPRTELQPSPRGLSAATRRPTDQAREPTPGDRATERHAQHGRGGVLRAPAIESRHPESQAPPPSPPMLALADQGRSDYPVRVLPSPAPPATASLTPEPSISVGDPARRLGATEDASLPLNASTRSDHWAGPLRMPTLAKVVEDTATEAPGSLGCCVPLSPESHAETGGPLAAQLCGERPARDEAFSAQLATDIGSPERDERRIARNDARTDRVEAALVRLKKHDRRPCHRTARLEILDPADAIDLRRRSHGVMRDVTRSRGPRFSEGPAICHLEAGTLPPLHPFRAS